MGTLSNALKKQINSNKRQESFGTSATILSYDKVYNVARIKFIDPNNGEVMFRENVPVCITMGGLTGGSIYPGQECCITFANNNIYSPIITGITTSLYNQKTSDDQGAYIVDSRILSCEKPEEIVPMCESWIDYDNTDTSKYENDISMYTDTDAAAIVSDIIHSMNKYKDNEQGITNLDNNSTIKVRDNGDIDIFVANNLGIRLSPSSKNISIYGSIVINGKEIDFEALANAVMQENPVEK